MEDELRKLFYNKYLSTATPRQLWLATDRKYTQKQIKEWVDKQQSKQVFQRPKKIVFRKVIANTNNTYQIDLTFYDQYKSQNKNYIGLFTAINIVSRKAYAYPIKNKSQQEITRVFKKFLNDVPAKPEVISSDNEQTFINEYKRYNIKYFLAPPGEHTGKTAMIDSFHRTLRSNITKYQTTFKTKNYIDILPRLLENYNSTEHSATKLAPNEVTEEDYDRIIMEMSSKDEKPKEENEDISIGDKVRTIKPKGKFDKGTQKVWSSQLYEVVDRDLNKYKIKSLKTNNTLIKPFARKDLQKVEGEVLIFETPKIHSTRQVKKVATKQKRQVIDFGRTDEVQEITPQGDIIFKKRLQPSETKRVRKQPKILNL